MVTPTTFGMSSINRLLSETDRAFPKWKPSPVIPPPPPTIVSRNFVKFCETMPLENAQSFSFLGREYLHDICNDPNKVIAIVKGRQTGITTFLIAKIIHNALLHDYTTSLYCTDTFDHATKFSQDRLDVILGMFGIARAQSEKKISRAVFPNGSILYVISGYNNFKQARSISADFVYLDEAQHLPLDSLANIKESMSQSTHGNIIISGTGDWEGSPWHKYYTQHTDMREYNNKEWIKLNPDNNYSGYHISQSLMPNITIEDLIEKQNDYTPSTYKMEVLGEFTTGAKVPLPYGLVIQAYDDTITTLQPSQINRDIGPTYATIDWASGGDAYTVLTITQQDKDSNNLQILYLERYNDSDVSGLGRKISDRMYEYNPDHIICDVGGNQGAMQILESDHTIQKVALGEHPGNPIVYHDDRALFTIDKSTHIQQVIQWFEKHEIKIPLNPNTEWSIDHLTAEESTVVTKSTGGTVLRFGLQKNRNDDFLMTLVFLAVALNPANDTNNRGVTYVLPA